MDRVSASRKFRYVSRRDAALRLVFLGQFNMVIIVFFFRKLVTGNPGRTDVYLFLSDSPRQVSEATKYRRELQVI